MGNWFLSINQRLVALFLIIGIIPVVAVGISNTISTQRILNKEIEERQLEVTRLTSNQISQFIDDLVFELANIGRITQQNPQNDYAILEQQVSDNSLYQSVQVIDSNGQELARYENGRLVERDELENVVSREIFFRPMRDERYFSSVRLDSSQKPTIQIAVPVRSGDTIVAAIAAQINLQSPWDIIRNQQIGENGYILLLDKRGNVIVQSDDNNGAVSYIDTPLMQLARDETGRRQVVEYQSPLGDGVIGSISQISGPDWLLVTERPIEEAHSAALLSRRNAYFGVGLSLILAIPLAVILSRQVTRPIVKLSESARQIMSGNMDVQTEIDSRDEIGDLARAFNQMTSQLRSLIQTLEQQIETRTRDLSLAVDVSQQLASYLQLDELLTEVAKQTRETFDLYAMHVFLVDEDRENLVLKAGDTPYSDNNTMLNIPLTSPKSLVVQCMHTKETIIVQNVARSDHYMAIEGLPDTRSEMVLPLIRGEQIIGVIDLQSKTENRFDDSTERVMTIIARHVSVAIENAQYVDEQVKVAEELRLLDTLKSQFLASMSHELRTPLNAIINFTQFVAVGIYGQVSEQQHDALNKVITSAEHLLSLINDILDFSKIESGMLQLFIQEVDIQADIIKAVQDTASGLSVPEGVALCYDIAEDLPGNINGDKRRLRQILINLISNALKFTDSGSITLKAWSNNGSVYFSVTDTGIGIEEESLAAIFEPFQQTEAGQVKGKGTGLGLPISRHLAEAHQGKLWVESKFGAGSTFVVEIPIKRQTNNATT